MVIQGKEALMRVVTQRLPWWSSSRFLPVLVRERCGCAMFLAKER
jgi:hypothetical protein